MAGRTRRTAAQQPQDTATGEGLTEHPTVSPETVETATEGAPEAKYGEPREMATEDYAERPYADALSPEHADTLRQVGQHPDQQEG